MQILLLQRARRAVRAILAQCIWRIGGPRSPDALAHQLHSMLAKPGSMGFFERLTTYAYRHELTAHAFLEDAYLTRDCVDIFSTPYLSSKYLEEFSSVANKLEYTKAGVINSVAFSLYSLTRHCCPTVFIESGTASGYSASFIAEALGRNTGKPTLVCLSLFDDEQRKMTKARLAKYELAKVVEGESQEFFKDVVPQSPDESYAMFIDGPKARSAAWEALTNQVAEASDNLTFVCFDSCQEHAPFLGGRTGPDRHDEVRSLNWERAKVLSLYEEKFRHRGFRIAFQSNQFCEKYAHLNDEVHKRWNEEIGDYFKWGPYEVDRIHRHFSHSFKLGVIYHPERCQLGQQLDEAPHQKPA